MSRKQSVPEGQMEIEMTGFGPVDRVETVALSPIVICRGANGIGKSQLREGVSRALGDKEAQPLETRGGQRPGRLALRVQDWELVLTGGKSLSVAGGKDFPVRLGHEAGRLLGDLIGPLDVAGSLSYPAKKARIKALAKMARLEVTQDRLAELAGGLDLRLSAPLVADDLPAAEVLISKRLRILAETEQSAVDQLLGQLAQLQARIQGLEIQAGDQVTAAELDAAVEAERLANIAVYEAQASRKAREVAERERASVRDDLPRPEWGEEILDLIHRLHDSITAGNPLNQDLQLLVVETASLGRLLHERKLHAEAYQRAQEVLARKIEGATQATILEAAERHEASKILLEGLKSRTAAAQQIANLQIESASMGAKLAEQRLIVERYRSAAKGTKDRLAGIMSACGLKSLRVLDGEILAQINGEWVPFAEASTGERVGIALQAWIETAQLEDGKRLLIMLPAEYWYHLDEAARVTLRCAFEPLAGRVTLWTEECDEGEFRIETFEL